MVPIYDLPLSAIALAGLLYPTWRIAQLGKRALHNNPAYTGKQPQADQVSLGRTCLIHGLTDLDAIFIEPSPRAKGSAPFTSSTAMRRTWRQHE